MPGDTFRLFKASLETVLVKKDQRGLMSFVAPDIATTKALVKRRNSMENSVQTSEDFNSRTTIHFKPSVKAYMVPGNFVQIDGVWRTMLEVKEGKNFNNGKVEFYLVKVDDDILPTDDSEPDWVET